MILYKTKESEIVRVDGGSDKQSLKKYSTTIIGDGIKTVFTIEHHLDTEDIIFEMNDGTEPALIDYVVIDKDNVNITFAVAPTVSHTYHIKIYGTSKSDSNISNSGNGNNSDSNNNDSDNNENNSDDSNTIDPSKIGTIHDDWNYTLDEANNIITLNYYTGADTNVTVYSFYKINDSIYKTQIISDGRKLEKFMFSGKSRIKNITFSDELDTSNVVSMSCMFKACFDLNSVSFDNFNTSNVTDMSYMFQDCKSLTGITFNNFDTSNVTNMKLMFYNCENLVRLYLDNFDTSNATNMNRMFCGCKKLESIYVDSAKWTTTNADTGYMFLECGTETVTYI